MNWWYLRELVILGELIDLVEGIGSISGNGKIELNEFYIISLSILKMLYELVETIARITEATMIKEMTKTKLEELLFQNLKKLYDHF